MSEANVEIRYLERASAELVEWCTRTLAEAPGPEQAAERIARRLGARVASGRATFGFWTPELAEHSVLDDDLFLEVFVPPEGMSLLSRHQTVQFERKLLPLARAHNFVWGVYEGLPVGTRDQLGVFYWVKYCSRDGVWRHIPDHLAASVPFGAFAPAELYDVESLHANRKDRAYFQRLAAEAGEDGVYQHGPPVNILQIHVPTATGGGTLASLARHYERIAHKIESGHELLPHEETYLGYDAVQLLPVEPTIEYEAGPRFWKENDESNPRSDTVDVELRRPDMTNWGYDVVISGSAAVNPTLLESDRPDELVDLAETLHNFPGKPIKLIFDVVFGHADNQAVPLVNRFFFTGPNMYGQDLNYRHPYVRAIMLEMQRRKVNFGADGVRVDGAQDFRWWDAEDQVLRHDDEYLQSMSDIVQEVCGTRYRPWMVFEDGRPWPQEDWELASTYRAVIEQQPNVFQWGPLSFAHNTPFLYTFWVQKWWRIEEILAMGENWISGCANHDTLRRGTQVAPNKPFNRRLGGTLLEILDKAYDNPAASLLTYSMFPGVPMEFINATMRASWGFIRNTDDRYGVKVVSEEAVSINWQMDEASFNKPNNFRRMKEFGFLELDELKRFMRLLETAVIVSDYDLDAMVQLMSSADPPLAGPDLSEPVLKQIARAWMDDMHDYCNVSYYADRLSPAQTHFNMVVREFRRERPWLRHNLRGDEFFDRRRPAMGNVVFYGLRRAPDGREEILFVANMEGHEIEVVPTELPIPNLAKAGWRNAVASPGLHDAQADEVVKLEDSEGVVFVRHAAPTAPVLG